jgi:hypothetical protein
MRSPQDAENGRRMARIMIMSGVATIIAGVALGALVWTPLYFIAVLGLFDFGFAWAYANGRIGTARPVEGDPSYNSYARED